MTYFLFTDGGTILKNPSPIGGCWAWILVDKNNTPVAKNSGVIEPCDINLPTITNNLIELFAVIKGITSCSNRQIEIDGIFSDSQVTIRRITVGNKFNGIPSFLKNQTLELRKNRKWWATLLGGHPNKEELKNGFRKDRKPVSKWNVWCDKRCQQLAKEFFQNLEEF